MLPINEIPGTFKFYDEKGRRLSIFLVDGKIIIFTCSKEDLFSKKQGRYLLEGFLSNDPSLIYLEEGHPEVVEGPFKDKNEFFDYLTKRFAKGYTDTLYFPNAKIVEVSKGKKSKKGQAITFTYTIKS